MQSKEETKTEQPNNGDLDEDQRKQLRNHHTATKIMLSACRKVLGPHILQVGAEATVEEAHLDITHGDSLTSQKEIEIENEANRIILSAKQIGKDQVQVNVEACCETHVDNISEVGWIKMLRTTGIADGTVRLHYVAGERTIQILNAESDILNKLGEMWKISQDWILETGERFFQDCKKFESQTSKLKQQFTSLQLKYVIDNPQKKRVVFKSDEDEAKIDFSFLDAYAQDLKNKTKSIIYVGEKFVYGILGDPEAIDVEKFKVELSRENDNPEFSVANEISHQITQGEEKTEVKGIVKFSYIGSLNSEAVFQLLGDNGFEVTDL